MFALMIISDKECVLQSRVARIQIPLNHSFHRLVAIENLHNLSVKGRRELRPRGVMAH